MRKIDKKYLPEGYSIYIMYWIDDFLAPKAPFIYSKWIENYMCYAAWDKTYRKVDGKYWWHQKFKRYYMMCG